MISGIKKVLVIAPHADDGEFSCGGSIKRFTEEGIEVYYTAFSPCNKSMPQGYKENQLYDELSKAVKHLGINDDHIITYDFPVREFPKYRQEILEELIKLKRKLAPDVVMLPNSNDIHQDHHVIYEEGIRAFKHHKLLGYELPWNNLCFENSFHIKLKREHIERKLNAISEYKSQQFRPYVDEEFFFGLAKMRGIQINVEYAEAFELIRWFI
ncbi:MAG: PIG-L family deacetylase [Balneola sp.]